MQTRARFINSFLIYISIVICWNKSSRNICKKSKKIPVASHIRLDDDSFIVRYLRVAKYDLKKAEEKITALFQLMLDWPEVFADLKWTPDIEKVFDAGIMELMEPDEDGCWVLTSASGRWDPAEIPAHALHQEMDCKLQVLRKIFVKRTIISNPKSVGLSARMAYRARECASARHSLHHRPWWNELESLPGCRLEVG